ncbi:uncharacterized protein LOC124406225 [Diprion similis]|uniref:uncharacterized protein LOC124406225 n=1 Tax=Diprion similis TaxID=362088 RepID=UPI001EF78317|nr:uncharacterized protein LOC124406225 [Diprion similis]
MCKDIRSVIRNCDTCQRVKYNNICMEGVQYLLVVMDAFSKYVSLYPIQKTTTRISLVKLIKDYFPKLAWKETLEKEGIKTIYSSIRHPQSNPTERYMRELGRFFRTYCSEQHTKWAKYVKQIEEILNLTTHHSTGYTPYEVHFNKNPKFKIKELIDFPNAVPISDNFRIHNARKNLKSNSKKRAKYQKSISKITFQENDLVLLRVPQISNAIDKNKRTRSFFGKPDNNVTLLLAYCKGPYPNQGGGCTIQISPPQKLFDRVIDQTNSTSDLYVDNFRRDQTSLTPPSTR